MKHKYRYAKELFDHGVNEQCERQYLVDNCECNRKGLETGRCDKAKLDQDQEVDECTAACCDPSRNYRLRARNLVKGLMTNEYINRCWCEWANSGTWCSSVSLLRITAHSIISNIACVTLVYR